MLDFKHFSVFFACIVLKGEKMKFGVKSGKMAKMKSVVYKT
jgi:hypothetical protein